MNEKWASITALITAYCRGYHATHDSPKIFDDYVAAELFTTEEHYAFDQQLAGTLQLINPARAAAKPDQATALACVMQTHNGPITLSRSRYTEDQLTVDLDQGVRQYVILGAGFDTFAFRRPDLLDRLHVFEVDHPATQAIKRERLAMLQQPFPTQLHFVPIDFTTQRLSGALLQSGYDPRQPSFFSWLGVTYYLTRDVIVDTLRDVAALMQPAAIAPAGSVIVFDYMEADAFIPERAAKRIQLLQAIAGQVGEPMQTGFDPIELAAELDRAGFRLEEDLDPAAIEARYFQNRSDEYHAFEQVHFVRAVIV